MFHVANKSFYHLRFPIDVYMFSFPVPNFSNRSPFVLKHKTPSKSSIHLGTGAAYSSVLNLATKKYKKASSCPSFSSLAPSSRNKNGNSTRHSRNQPGNDYTRHPRALLDLTCPFMPEALLAMRHTIDVLFANAHQLVQEELAEADLPTIAYGSESTSGRNSTWRSNTPK